MALSSDVTIAEAKKQEEQPRFKKHITITACPTEHCEILYTDTLCESILIECKSPKHNSDTAIQKVEEEGKVTRPANSNPQPNVPESPSENNGGLQLK